MNEPIWRTMTRLRARSLFVLALFILLGRCASRPVNPWITHVDPNPGYRFVTRPQYSTGNENLPVLAFSGGGTRAARFSFGVLQFLRNTEDVGPKGRREVCAASWGRVIQALTSHLRNPDWFPHSMA